MPEENEYEIEEGDVIRYFDITRIKDGKIFIVEQVHYSVSDTTENCFYDKNGSPIMGSVGSHRKECRAIDTAITKYLEKKKQTIKIEVKGGTVVDVRNLPEGCNYELIDRDVMEEER